MEMKTGRLTSKIKFIVKRWKDGELVLALAKRYKCTPAQIKRVIVDVVGAEEYRRTNNKRTGGGALIRKKRPHYPDWMTTGQPQVKGK